ncbi:hypothetical protein [Chlorobium sp. N1]|uniref:hypothetical protein n=1 Tax=Chlorobium sp. N1 TaxID=2491138 RepID=UPI00103D28D3|nr:hypothetical protein [Chlorobium sp. N1]TCD47755.1 hypothetical protein E0L29_05605 [Chlorobium sp. N1]
MKKILFLAASYPPYMTDGASRAYRMASRLPGYGWEPVVVAPPAFVSGEGEAGSGVAGPVRVYRTGAPVEIGALEACQLASFARGERIAQGGRLSAVIPTVFRQAHPSEAWEKQASVVAEEVMKEHPDIEAIYAQGPPSAPLRLGLELSLRHGVPAMFDLTAPLDMARPWSPLSDQHGDELARLEQKVLSTGYSVITPTRALKEHFLRKHFGKVAHDDITIISDCGPLGPAAASGGPSAVSRPLVIVERAEEKGLRVFFSALASLMRESGAGSIFSGATVVDSSGGMVAKQLRKAGIEGDLVTCCTPSEEEELALLRAASAVGVITGGYRSAELWLPGRLIDAAFSRKHLFTVAPEGVATRFVEECGGSHARPADREAIGGMLSRLAGVLDGGLQAEVPAELLARHGEEETLTELVRSIAMMLPV